MTTVTITFFMKSGHQVTATEYSTERSYDVVSEQTQLMITNFLWDGATWESFGGFVFRPSEVAACYYEISGAIVEDEDEDVVRDDGEYDSYYYRLPYDGEDELV